ncbi:nephrin-like [Styela clava]
MLGLYQAEKWIVMMMLFNSVACQVPKHYFVRQPFNTTVSIGGRASLRCAIANLHTEVQWSVDGFGLGRWFSDPRLSLTGSESKGEYNLQIVNVKLEDDGMYRCQATGSEDEGLDNLISRAAYLNVIVPPKKVRLEPSVSGVIDVKYPNSVKITCSVPETKPASVIKWRVQGKEYSGSISKKVLTKWGSKLVTTSSSITLQPSKVQNGSMVECIVSHLAMNSPISSISKLNVLYPPSAPRISGFAGQPMRSGDQLSLKCEAAGGNPSAKITWLIDDEVIHGEYTPTKDGSQSLLRHKLRPDDDGKILTCRGESPALDSPLTDQLKLEVQYPPENIVIERDPEDGAPENGIITLTCHYARSNPRASLAWFIDGIELPLHWSDGVVSVPYMIRNLGADPSAARISLTLTSVRRQDANAKITCRATIPEIDYVGEASTYPKVNYPPRKLALTTFSLSAPVTITPTPSTVNIPDSKASENSSGKEVSYKVGDVVLLRCETRGGNPPPNLNWHRDDTLIIGDENTAISAPEVKVYTGKSADGATTGEFITISTLELTLEASHNDAVISCAANHPGYQDTLVDKKKLSVAFPPSSLIIEQFPSTSLVVGNPMSLTCTTSSSNPPAKITWYRNNVEFSKQYVIELPLTVGELGGYVASSRLRITNPKVEDDGADIACKAEVHVLQQSITKPHKLNIEYPPVFYPIGNNAMSINATYGDNFVDIETIAHSNPSGMTYSYFRILSNNIGSDGGEQITKKPLTKDTRLVWNENSGRLRINSVMEDDGGLYMIRATNARGSTELNITLNVFYPARITSISGPTTTLQEGDSTELRCDFKSHPLTPAHVTWVKEIPGNGRDSYDVENFQTHSILSLANITADDRGGYRCVVDNGIGEPATDHIKIDMLYSPAFFDVSPSKVAVSSVDSSGALSPAAVLPCIVHSTPASTITWIRGESPIVVFDNSGFSVINEVIDFETSKSTLRVANVQPNDANINDSSIVAQFRCVATNKQGKRTKLINIVLQGPPDAPSNLHSFNTSHSSVYLIWKPGFDGGVQQKFVVQYKEIQHGKPDTGYQKLVAETNEVLVEGLKANKRYTFQVFAKNSYGESDPCQSIVLQTAISSTRESRDVWAVFGVAKGYVITLAVVSLLIFIFVIGISVIAFRRCRIAKQSYKPKTIETDCESLTHAESSLSSRGSTSKRRQEKVDTDCKEDQHMLTRNVEGESGFDYQFDSEDPATKIISSDSREARQPCYLDCSVSRCDSQSSIDQPDSRYGHASKFSFPTFKDDVNAVTSQASLSRFGFTSQSARMQRPITEEPHMPRNFTQPRFRRDVLPSDECLTNNRRKSFDKSLDLPLPPVLPLYEGHSYSKRPSGGNSCDALSSLSYSGTNVAKNTQGLGYRSSLRQYRTLDSSRYSFDPYCEDCCSAIPECRTSFVNSKPILQNQSIYNVNSAETCLYNVVSRPSDPCGYTTSLMSMSDNPIEEYAVDVDRDHSAYGGTRNSQSSSTSSNSGLYVRSLDNMSNATNIPKQRTSIVNDDGTINTFGLDLPLPESRSNALGVIDETGSQHNSSNLTGTGENETCKMSSPSATNERFTKDRKSSMRSNTSTIPSRQQKRDTNQTVRFRDELSLALNVSRTNASQNLEHNHSDDDDTDSGCGGSADVAVHSDRSPTYPTPEKFSTSSAFTPVGEGGETVLRI